VLLRGVWQERGADGSCPKGLSGEEEPEGKRDFIQALALFGRGRDFCIRKPAGDVLGTVRAVAPQTADARE